MRENKIPRASDREIDYVRAFSRQSTVDAYAQWQKFSNTESQYVDRFIKIGDRVLDLGCGTGRIPSILGEKIIRGYLGIDCSTAMITKAKELNPGFRFLCEDILEPTYTERNFDVVLLMNNVVDMLHPIARRQALFGLARNVLAPSGVMISSSHLAVRGGTAGYYEETYHGAVVSTYRSSFGQLCEEIERHGFEIIVAARDVRSKKADWAYIAASRADG